MSTWWCEYAQLPDGLHKGVRLTVDDGRITAVEARTTPAAGDERLAGVPLPGLANVHSHAFHRALRGRTHGDGGNFWTWREQMYAVTRHGRVGSLAEAAAARGVEPRDIVKTLVVRRGDGDYLLVLVPGDRDISWPKLRTHLGVNRLSMPDAGTAYEATGYERGTITPFGSTVAWPVIADTSMAGRSVSMGAGAHGVAVTVNADDAIAALGADLADVTDLA